MFPVTKLTSVWVGTEGEQYLEEIGVVRLMLNVSLNELCFGDPPAGTLRCCTRAPYRLNNE